MAKRFSLSKIVAAANNLYVTKAGDPKGKTDEWIDTGCYALNAILSGSVYKGAANNRIFMFAGEEAVGKTFFTLRIASKAIAQNFKTIYFDSENAVEEDTFYQFGFKEKGNDFEILPIKSIEDLRVQSYKIIQEYKEYYDSLTPEEYPNRQKLLFIIDSIGMLTSENAIKNLEKGEVKRDMSKNQLLRELFRDITLDSGIMKIPLFVINHVYESMDMYGEKKKVSGGGGGKYGASAIIMLSKKKDRDKDGNIVGVIIKAKALKHRFLKEGKEVELYLNFDKGLDPNFGLHNFLENYTDLVKKVRGPAWELIYKGKNEKGEYVKVDKINTPEIMKELLPILDEHIKAELMFGNKGFNSDDISFDDEIIESEEDLTNED